MLRRRLWRHLQGLGVPGAVVLVGATVVFAAVVVAAGLASAASQRGDARVGSIDEAKAELVVLASFAPGLTRDGTLDRSERRGLDAAWMRLTADEPPRLLRVWRGDGSLLYRAPGDGLGRMPQFRPGSVPRAVARTGCLSPRMTDPG